MHATILCTTDFRLTGAGENAAWDRAPWLDLTRVKGHAPYRTRFKALWSGAGLYVLYDCADRRLTSTGLKNFADLWKEDVIEVFLWPLESQALYFEYELSPLNRELPILVPNHEGTFHGWLPWHYEGKRRCRHATRALRGGKLVAPVAGAQVQGWRAEMFLPFALFVGLGHCPPQPGTNWRANFFRIDHDRSPLTQWAWDPRTGPAFHNYKQFGTITFER